MNGGIATTELFGIQLSCLDRVGAVAQISSWLDHGSRVCRYVVTPNVDHIVRLESSAEFRDAYAHASLVLADGRPVVAVARFFGLPIRETVPGSDLVPLLFSHVSSNWCRPLRVFLLGAQPGVAIRAAHRIAQTWAKVEVCGVYSPPFGFESDLAECQNICDRIAHANVDLLIVGLGAPKQELWVRGNADQLPVRVALCVGATIDFLAGEKMRAPKAIQAMGLEWLFRMLSEPRRLAGRYLFDARVFPKLFFREWLARRHRSV